MTTAQVIFSVALGVIAVIIVAFAVFVLSTTMWGNRWVGKKNYQRHTMNHSETDNP